MGTTDADQTVRRFVAAWERGDVDELLSYFTDDAVLHWMPMKPAVGKPALREAISDWVALCTQLGVEIHLQVSDGNVVMHERTDRFSIGAQEHVSPICAVFEIDNGLITAWREYFDMSPFVGLEPNEDQTSMRVNGGALDKSAGMAQAEAPTG
jgi:limonene-1,2-epoxide hydrolase